MLEKNPGKPPFSASYRGAQTAFLLICTPPAPHDVDAFTRMLVTFTCHASSPEILKRSHLSFAIIDNIKTNEKRSGAIAQQSVQRALNLGDKAVLLRQRGKHKTPLLSFW